MELLTDDVAGPHATEDLSTQRLVQRSRDAPYVGIASQQLTQGIHSDNPVSGSARFQLGCGDLRPANR